MVRESDIKQEIEKRIDKINKVIFFAWSSFYLLIFFTNAVLQEISIVNLLPYMGGLLTLSAVINFLALTKYDKECVKEYNERFREMFLTGTASIALTIIFLYNIN